MMRRIGLLLLLVLGGGGRPIHLCQTKIAVLRRNRREFSHMSVSANDLFIIYMCRYAATWTRRHHTRVRTQELYVGVSGVGSFLAPGGRIGPTRFATLVSVG